MTPSAILYAAADYMREHGFTPRYEDGCARCFMGAMYESGCWHPFDSPSGTILRSIVPSISYEALSREDWNTDDAVAALTIAADIAFEDERARG